ncbi:MAG: 3-dehydroquinate synthase [bacterium]|nr:3-dehydroquinate synthase [bacterium]MDT8396248.1 3-dehydroquinate synthase [bacterium]
MVQIVNVGLDDRSYSIQIGPGSWDGLVPHLAASLPTGVIMVTDERVDSLYGETVHGMLVRGGVRVLRYVVPEGEPSKSFEKVEALCRTMAASDMDRGSLVLALGGGVVGDLAGFAASVYLRGVRFVQMPTTLLAMVDSSVGGKTGINIPEGKNLVGTFYQPEAVFAETPCLSTLETRDWDSGLAEVVKIAIALDEELFRYMESVDDLSPGGGLDVARIVAAACARKAEVVELDERETGLRRVLNFGHTLAHVIEASLGFGVMRHGEAVLLGMGAALRLSVDLCSLPEEQYARASALLRRIPTPEVTIPDEAALYLSRDKKSVGSSVHAVLVSGIGQHRIVPLEDPAALLRALKEWKKDWQEEK